jgi:hypothetical protein
MEPTSRRRFLTVATATGVGSLAGCIGGFTATGDGGDGGDGEQAGGDWQAGEAAQSEDGEQSGDPDGKTVKGIPLAGSQLPVEYEFAELRDAVRDGGPPKDGIPSIDEPSFWDAEAADAELDDRDVVFGLVRNGAVRAYPQKILAQHEIVNDVVGDDPVSVTYCPLTGTAMGFRRGETTFGVSGNLVNNNLVMYDRETDSRWPQVLGTAISGEFEGESLQEFRLVWTRWAEWKAAHPDMRVLSTDTGHARNYDNDPYGSYVPERAGYYIRDSTLFPPLGDDDTFPNKHVVMGTRGVSEEGRIAFEKDALRETGLLSGTVSGTEYLAVYDSALDTAYVYRNPAEKSFDYDAGDGGGNGGSAGKAVAEDGTTHDPADLPLDRVYAFDAMWFAWSGFYLSTEVVQ